MASTAPRAALALLCIFAVLAILLPRGVFMVKRHDFKRCDQSGFCIRQRAYADLADLAPTSLAASYSLDLPSIMIDSTAGTVRARLVDAARPSVLFSLELDLLAESTVRLRVIEESPIRSRHQLHPPTSDQALALDVPKPASGSTVKVVDGAVRAEFKVAGKETVVSLGIEAFKVVVTSAGVPVLTMNEFGYLHYEHHRNKSDPVEPEPTPEGELSEAEKEIQRLKGQITKDMWEESFGGKQDSKPYGPTSIGIDINFPGSEHVYGLPEHASSFALKPTRGAEAPYTDPYRLYNFDVFEYELDNPMALYGSIPFLMAHSAETTLGVLFINSAEMWVDVEKVQSDADKLALGDEKSGPVSSKAARPSTRTHWMVESGILDVMLFLGPKPHDVSNQLSLYSGRSAMPQYFAIGYHQCRWNYQDEQDVADVDANFDVNDIPYDVLWLDIEHTDGKRYLTWDSVKFPTPKAMQEGLASKGRKMVTIVDPHIKSDDGYRVSKKAKDLDLFVKGPNGKDSFDGWCWPGSSNWIDYVNPDSRKFWAEQFKYSAYEGSTPSLYTWNDMNEPSVFNGPEITMPKDNRHYGDLEHRDVHNLYGALVHRATYEGHLLRNDGTDRPFVLSRAYFIGTQRYGAIWTGDNFAQWDHLDYSVPMILSTSIAGVVFSGADVGGFFGNPEPQLLVRWYQTGVFQPFFRAHAHIDTKRREPWLFGEPYTSLIREAVRTRYRLLPYLYTLFWEANQNGKPVMRPLVSEFPEDKNTFDVDYLFMLGSDLLVAPVTVKDAPSIEVYLPTESNWYDYATLEKVNSGTITVETPLEKTPVFLRGGSIIPRRDRIRRSSTLTLKDPFTLVIALDAKNSASGQLYVDDGRSYEHEKGAYILTNFVFANGVLTATTARVDGAKQPAGLVEKLGSRVERLILTGLKAAPKSVVVKGGSRLEFQSETLSGGGGVVVTVKDPKVMIGESWGIEVHV
ncbi:glycosyl hydrolases family 31-domain-containing protein [Zopfochytrium polystomum]|nr:glycosyl hydrolases family 31-domain-containing protein [Zopfochytrium polystomum]